MSSSRRMTGTPHRERRGRNGAGDRRHLGHRPRHRAQAGGRWLRVAARGPRPGAAGEGDARPPGAHRGRGDRAPVRRARGRRWRLVARHARSPARCGGVRRRAARRPGGEPARRRCRGAGDAHQLCRPRAADGGAGRTLRAARRRGPGRRQLGGGRTGTRIELRLRLGQGGVHRVPLRSAQPAGRLRRPCGDGQAGLRAHPHDRRDEPAGAADRDPPKRSPPRSSRRFAGAAM